MPEISIKQDQPLSALIRHHPGFAPLQEALVEHLPHRQWLRNDEQAYYLQVTVFGKTGYGKSSLVNALAGHPVMETSSVEACTRSAQSVEYFLRDEYFSIADFPGVGESAAEDAAYRTLYQEMLAYSDLILYVLRADQRDWSIDEEVLGSMLPTHRDKILLVLNQCDKIEPIQRKATHPSPEQMRHIEQKIQSIQRTFPDLLDIVPCSVATQWNLDALIEAILHSLFRQPGVRRVSYQSP